jgi:hypothetical protein
LFAKTTRGKPGFSPECFGKGRFGLITNIDCNSGQVLAARMNNCCALFMSQAVTYSRGVLPVSAANFTAKEERG